MSIPSTLQCGVITILFAGMVCTVELVWAKMLKDLGFPYFRVAGSSALLSCLMFGICAKVAGEKFPPLSKGVWVILRAAFGSLGFLSAVVAVQIGAQPGDAAALMSINIVGAALMGHLFLTEKLRCLHILALLLSVSGAICISKPEVLFGASDSGTSSWLGNSLALVSGFCISCLIICARKSADVSKAYTCSCTAAAIAFVSFALPCTPLMDDGSFSVAMASPWTTLLAVLGVTLVLTPLSIATDTVGAVMCPAAVSATVRTASSMVSGYLAQTLIFHSAPDWLTVLGAVLMLVAVVIMAAVRVTQNIVSDVQLDQAADDNTSANSADTGAESLASFVAAEYAEWDPHVTARLRRPPTQGKPVALTIGVGTAVAALAV